MLRALLGALQECRGRAGMAARVRAMLELRDALSGLLPLRGIVNGRHFDGATKVLAAQCTCSVCSVVC